MKTSLKQLGRFSDVLCGKGFRGHVVIVRSGMIHLHECVCEVLTLQGVGGYYKTVIPLSSGHITASEGDNPHIQTNQPHL